MITTIKTCFKCNTEKPLDDFYKHSQMADGHVTFLPPPKGGGFPAGVGNTYSGRHRFRLSHSKVLAHARGAGYWLAQ